MLNLLFTSGRTYRIPFTALFLMTLFSFFVKSSSAQLVVTPNPSIATLIASLAGQGLTVTNVQLNCPSGAYGTFNGTASNIGIANGILLTTGNVNNAVGPNNSTSAGTCNGTVQNDPQLTSIEPQAVNDLCVLEFDIVPQCSTLQIRFVFGSEEYPEFVNSSFNDAFGFFITGMGPNCSGPNYNNTNVATLPNNVTPVTIDNVNPNNNSAYYFNNTGGTTVQYDGFTVALTRNVALCPCATYHFKIAIADAGDCIYDSGVFLDFIACQTVLTATTSTTPASCTCTGTATATGSGTQGPYTYSWVPGNQTTQTATGLCAGTYTCYVNDAWTCTPATTVTVTVTGSSSGLTLAPSQTNVLCNGQCNGSATVVASGAPGPYTYTWTPGGQTTQTATGLCAGNYSVTVTASNGCTGTQAFTITQPPALVASIGSSTNVVCFGGNNGSATVSATGGTLPYAYNWSPSGGTGATATGLTAGNYTVTVTDANGCTTTATVTITQPPQLTLAVAGFDVSCNGSCDGQAVCIPSGGTPNYTFSWAPSGGTNPSATGLCAGTYTVYVTDQNGCTANDTAIVNQPAPMVIATSSTTSNCGQPDGSACANVSGGNPPYTYQWSPSNQTGNCASNIGPGTYTVTVTDFNGCTQTATVVVPTTPVVTATITASTNESCGGVCDGTATVTASGGSQPYTYAWAPSGGNAATGTGLCAGTYTVTVTDPFGCSATATVTITSPSAVTVSTTQVDVLCNGACTGSSTASASGGTGPYTYAWSNLQNTQTSTGLCAGTYTVTATDANGCTGQTTVTITEPTAVGVTAVAAPAIICVGSSSTLTATGSGGTAPYTFAWAPNGSGSSINVTPTTTTIYTVTVTDANGCTANNTVTVTVNPLPVVSFTSNPTPAAGCAPLCVDFTSTTPNSTSCSWDFTVGTASTCSANFCFTNPGSYDVSLTVTDNNGCVNTLTLPAYVTVYPDPVADFSMAPQPTSVLNGTITFTDLSQGNPNQWQWSFGDVLNSSSTQQNPQFTYTDSGNYVVTLIVTTQYGCVDSISKTLRIGPDYTIYVPNAFTPNGDNTNETFYPKGSGLDESKFRMWIFDRWGNLIWYTEKWGKGWDGRANEGKDIAQEDVYVWKIEVYDYLGTKHQYVGHVSLIK